MHATAAPRNTEKTFTKVAFFGYDTFSAQKNLAVDEILEEIAERENILFVRFYNFSGPAAILGSSCDPDSGLKPGAEKKIEVSRRITAGTTAYVDGSVLGYSIIGPTSLNFESGEVIFNDRIAMHRYFGVAIAAALRSALHVDPDAVSVGKKFSVKINGIPFVSNGQHFGKSHAFTCHGVIPILPWNVEAINEVLNVDPDDYSRIPSMPSAIQFFDGGNEDGAEACKAAIIKAMLAAIPKDALGDAGSSLRGEVLERADALAERKYKGAWWVRRTDIRLDPDTRFCPLYPD